VVFEKVWGERNPADLMTKSLGIKVARGHCDELKLQPEEGRASKSSKLSKGLNSFGLMKRFIKN
jgi:hypothetical protein